MWKARWYWSHQAKDQIILAWLLSRFFFPSCFAHFFKNSEKISLQRDLITGGVPTYFWKWFNMLKPKNVLTAAHLTSLWSTADVNRWHMWTQHFFHRNVSLCFASLWDRKCVIVVCCLCFVCGFLEKHMYFIFHHSEVCSEHFTVW